LMFFCCCPCNPEKFMLYFTKQDKPISNSKRSKRVL